MANPSSTAKEAQPTTRRGDLGQLFVRGIAWTALVKWGSQILSWVAVAILARLLTPEDYGLVGLATLYLGFVGILTEGGLGSTIVAMRQMTKLDIAQFHTVAVLMGILGTALTCLAAYPLGWFFGSGLLPPVLFVLSANAVLSATRLVPMAVLQRDLRFRGLAAVEGIQSIVTTLATIGLAWRGASYWALVIGGIVGNLIATGMSYALSPQAFAWPTSRLGQYVKFTRDILIGRLSWFVYTNADFIIAGRMLGTKALGWYTLAWNIASTPVEKVTALVTRVTPGFFSRLKDDRPALRQLLLTVTEGLVFLTLPAAAGMAVVADDFVWAYLGPQYLGAILPLRILALYATLRSVVTLLPQVLMLLGQTRFLMYNGLLTAVVLPAAFLFGSQWGPAGIALMWMVVYPLHLIPMYRRLFVALDLSPRDYLAVVWPALKGTLVMVAVLIGVRWAAAGMNPVPRLGLQILVGAIVFGGLTVWPGRHRLRQLRDTLRPPTPAPA